HRPARPGEDGDTARDPLDGGADDQGGLILLERAELAGPAGDEHPAGAGVTLLDRTGRTVKVTPAGRVFLAEARRILRLAEESSLAVRRIPTGAGGTLAVGFTAVSVYGYVRSFLRRIVAEFPHVDLVLREL